MPVKIEYDINLLVLENHLDVSKGNIEIVATGRMDAAALHAAVIHRNISKVTLIDSTTDWTKQASSYKSKNQVANVVPNVLNYYDLRDLPDMIPKTKVEFTKTLNQ